ncbi:MAG: tail fiber domain-containing protein, partial [Patescibacteria group bacterium]
GFQSASDGAGVAGIDLTGYGTGGHFEGYGGLEAYSNGNNGQFGYGYGIAGRFISHYGTAGYFESNNGFGLVVNGLSSLSTTTMSFNSKIGNTTQGYFTVENYPVGVVPANMMGPGNPSVDTLNSLPLIRFSAPNFTPDQALGGIADSLLIAQTSTTSNPQIMFSAKDIFAGAESSGNLGTLQYATTSRTFMFSGMNGAAITLSVTGSTTISSLGENGAVYSNNGLLTNTAPSSLEYKDSVASTTLNIDGLLSLQVKSFSWKNNGHEDYGLIAEDVKNAVPELYRDDGVTKGYRQDHLAFYLLQIAQRQEAELKALKASLGTSGLSVGPGGSLSVKSLKAEDLIVENGVTIRDRATGNYTCVYVENGTIKTSAGECASSQNIGTTIGGDGAAGGGYGYGYGYGLTP